VIPGNDDAIRSVRLITGAIADACIYGAARRREYQQQQSQRPDAGGPQTQMIYAGRGGRPAEEN